MDSLALETTLASLKLEHIEAQRQVSLLQSRVQQLSDAIAAVEACCGSTSTTMSETIVGIVQHAGIYISRREVAVRLAQELGRTLGRAFSHSVTTQIGYLVREGRLAKANTQLVGIPGFVPPPPRPDMVPRGRRPQLIVDILRQAQRPLHIDEISSELERQGEDGNHRLLAATLFCEQKRPIPRWRRCGRGTFEHIEP